MTKKEEILEKLQDIIHADFGTPSNSEKSLYESLDMQIAHHGIEWVAENTTYPLRLLEDIKSLSKLKQKNEESKTNKTCYENLLQQLEVKYQKAIASILIKDGVLHVEVTHKAFIDGLKAKSLSLLDKLSEAKECEEMKAGTVLVFCNIE